MTDNKYALKSSKTRYFKESTFAAVNQSCTTVPKFKPMLVKDLLQSFEKEKHTTGVTTDSTQKNSYQKAHNQNRPLNNHNLVTSLKSVSKSSEIMNSTVSHETKTIMQESKKIVSNKISESDRIVMHDNFTSTYHLNSKHSVNLNKENRPALKMQGLNDSVPCNYANKTETSDCTLKTDYDVTNAIVVIQNVVTQLKTFLVQSVQAHEDQASKLKQILNNLNEVSNVISKSDTRSNDCSTVDKKNNAAKVAASKDTIFNVNSSVLQEDTNSCEKYINLKKKAEQRLPIPSIKLINNESNQVIEKLSLIHLKPITRLPITTDVSCVQDFLTQAENESHIDNLNIRSPRTPKRIDPLMIITPKTLRRSRVVAAEGCDFQGRKRSLSTPSELDVTQGTFTMLERKLNIVHKLPVNSLKIPNNDSGRAPMPSFPRQWDKKCERAVEEYMALKTKSTFLVTPETNWFQSRLPYADTD